MNRYFKYIAKNSFESQFLHKQIRKSFHDLDDSKLNLNSNLLIPLNYYRQIKKRREANDSNATSNTNSFFYYHNCLADCLFKLFTKNIHDKFILCTLLLDLMPTNSDVIKQFVSLSLKVNSQQRTLQLFYDHLNIHSICDENLWILYV